MVIQSHRVERTGFSGALFLWKGSQTWAQTLTTGSQRPENVWSLPLRSSPLSQDALVAVAFLSFLLPVNWWGDSPFRPPQAKNVMEHVILVTRYQGSLAAMKGIRAKASWWRCLDLVWPQWMISWGGGKFTQKVFFAPTNESGSRSRRFWMLGGPSEQTRRKPKHWNKWLILKPISY